MVPKVSVIVPTYNRSSFLEDTVGSILSQTAPVHEVLLVDDGSTDDTLSTVADLQARSSDWKRRVRYINQRNQGKSVALNTGLQFATGDWIAFNDSDDCWLSQKQALQFAALEQYPRAGACFTDVRFLNNPKFAKNGFATHGRSHDTEFGVEKDLAKSMIVDGWPGIYMQTILVKKSIMQEVGEFDPELRVSTDMDFLFRLALKTPLCWVNLPLVEMDRTEQRVVGLITEHPPGTPARRIALERMLANWLSLTEASHPEWRRQLLDARASASSALANAYLVGGDLEAARSVLRTTVRRDRRLAGLTKLVLITLAPRLLRRLILWRRPYLRETPAPALHRAR